jgi:hypothetical protein
MPSPLAPITRAIDERHEELALTQYAARRSNITPLLRDLAAARRTRRMSLEELLEEFGDLE